jgi:hypothetical protein
MQRLGLFYGVLRLRLQCSLAELRHRKGSHVLIPQYCEQVGIYYRFSSCVPLLQALSEHYPSPHALPDRSSSTSSSLHYTPNNAINHGVSQLRQSPIVRHTRLMPLPFNPPQPPRLSPPPSAPSSPLPCASTKPASSPPPSSTPHRRPPSWTATRTSARS